MLTPIKESNSFTGLVKSFVIFTLLSLSLVYFLLKVCIQFNRINSLNLLLGMDVTKLYSTDENREDDCYLNYLVKKSAMKLYILSKKI